MIDVEITRNMQTYGTGRCSVRASRFMPLVMSMYAYTVHETASVRVDFLTAERASLYAEFLCGGSTDHPVFFSTAEAVGLVHRPCPKCLKKSRRLTPPPEVKLLDALAVPFAPKDAGSRPKLWYMVGCPRCGRPPGEGCKSPHSKAVSAHTDRIQAASVLASLIRLVARSA